MSWIVPVWVSETATGTVAPVPTVETDAEPVPVFFETETVYG